MTLGIANSQTVFAAIFDRTLVIAPHADDETLGAGGTIARAAASGCQTRVVVATVADLYYAHADRIVTGAERVAEARRACEELGATFDGVLAEGYESRLDTTPMRDLVAGLDRRLERFRPTAVLFPYPSHHQDHRAVYRAAIAALRPRGGSSEVSMAAVYEYPYINSHSTYDTTGHGLFHVGLSDREASRKMSALRAHASQMEGRESSHPISPESVSDWMKVRGRECGAPFAECFRFWRLRL